MAGVRCTREARSVEATSTVRVIMEGLRYERCKTRFTGDALMLTKRHRSTVMKDGIIPHM